MLRESSMHDDAAGAGHGAAGGQRVEIHRDVPEAELRSLPSGFLSLNLSSQRRIFDDDPPGMTALSLRPALGPPQRSLISSPMVTLPTSTSK